MAIISGVVRKDEDPVEGAKVYILYDGEVVASAETNVGGEYFCDGLDDDKKYHAVVEHSEVDGEEITHYSARSMPGITAVEDPRLFLYKDGEGGENWDDNSGGYVSWYFDSDRIWLSLDCDSGGGGAAYIETKEAIDITNFSSLKIEYEDVRDWGSEIQDFEVCVEGRIFVTHKNPIDKETVTADISLLSGSHKIEIFVTNGADYLEYAFYKIWLE